MPNQFLHVMNNTFQGNCSSVASFLNIKPNHLKENITITKIASFLIKANNLKESIITTIFHPLGSHIIIQQQEVHHQQKIIWWHQTQFVHYQHNQHCHQKMILHITRSRGVSRTDCQAVFHGGENATALVSLSWTHLNISCDAPLNCTRSDITMKFISKLLFKNTPIAQMSVVRHPWIQHFPIKRPKLNKKVMDVDQLTIHCFSLGSQKR